MSEFGPPQMLQVALALPLLAALLAALIGTTSAARLAHWPTILAFAGSAVLACLLLFNGNVQNQPLEVDLGVWFSAGNVSISWKLLLDPLSAIMLATVTFVATWIAIFSAGYMHGDEGFARYFALMSLFVFAMCLLVLANNFLVLIAGWEGVGLCSYLLVGYYYAKPSAAAAARKAFLVTRLGDVGLILGIFLLWSIGGFTTDLDTLFKTIAENPETHGRMTVACLLLFCGAVGKSAQLPLYVWLPDAMEGPTPVSALIHAATMVTAGVYLVARCAPLFVLSPTAQMTVALIGGLTALLAAFIAIAQNDLKRVLAYSTVSQLGFMFMALGTMGAFTPSLAVTAAIFHLCTHAFFKALLFLGSGSVMHAMGNVIDMRKFGGLKAIMPTTRMTFLIGSAALAGVPLLSGFWSKDQIIDSLFEAAEHKTRYQTGYWFVFAIALLTAGMTAFYTFRAYFLTFHGELRTPPEAGGHAHESPRIMTYPLVILAIGALFAGIILEPFTHYFSSYLGQTPSLMLANQLGHVETAETTILPHFNWTIAIISSVIALAGVALAWRVYGNGGPETVDPTVRGLYRLSQNKMYVDEVYASAVVTPAEGLATASRQFDSFLDGFVRLLAFMPRLLAAFLRPLQNGLLQLYALGMVLGLAVLITVIVVRTSR